MHWYDGSWHMAWMGIWWILGLAAIVAVLWLIVRNARRDVGESPERRLKRRYASGDIDREEYQQKLDELRR